MNGQLNVHSKQLESHNDFSSQESYADNSEKRDLKLHYVLLNDQGDMTMSINKKSENFDLSTEEGEIEIESPTYKESQNMNDKESQNSNEWDSSQGSFFNPICLDDIQMEQKSSSNRTTNGEECFDMSRRSSGVTYFPPPRTKKNKKTKKPQRKSLENWLVEGGTCPFMISGISQDIMSENKMSATSLEQNLELETSQKSDFQAKRKESYPPCTRQGDMQVSVTSKSIATCRKDGIFSSVSSYSYDDSKKAFSRTNWINWNKLLEAGTCEEKNSKRNWDWDYYKETKDEKKLRKSLKRLQQGPKPMKKKNKDPKCINKKKNEKKKDAYELELF